MAIAVSGSMTNLETAIAAYCSLSHLVTLATRRGPVCRLKLFAVVWGAGVSLSLYSDVLAALELNGEIVIDGDTVTGVLGYSGGDSDMGTPQISNDFALTSAKSVV